jgi:hypothetical protein
MGVRNVSVQLLQNESSYMIATIISHIRLKKDTEPVVENTPMATTNTVTDPHFLVYIICYIRYLNADEL